MKKCYSLLLLCLLAVSCVKEDDFSFSRFAGGSLSPSFALPVASAHIPLDSLLARSSFRGSDISVNSLPDGMYAVDYENNRLRYSRELPEMDSIRSTNIVFPSIIIPAGSVSGAEMIPFPLDGSFLEKEAKLLSLADSISLLEVRFAKGSWAFDVQSDINVPTSVVILCNNLIHRRTNNPLFDTLPLVAGRARLEVDLRDYVCTPNAGVGVEPNTVTFSYRLLMHVPNNSVVISSMGTEMQMQMQSMKIAYARAKIKSERQDIYDSVSFNLFTGMKENLSGEFRLDEMSLSFESHSNIGYPVDFHLESLRVMNDKGEHRNIAIPQPIILIPPSPAAGQLSHAMESMQLNIQDVMSIYPTKVVIRGYIVLNQNAAEGFFVQDPNISIKARLRIPLKGALKDVVYETDIPLESQSIPEEFLSASLLYNATNGYPFSAGVQIYCLRGDTITDSLFSSARLLEVPPAIVNAHGEAVQASTMRRSVDIGERHLDALRNATLLRMAVHLNTPVHSGGNSIIIKQGAAMDIKIGIKANTRITF